ncbi:IS66 family transposase [Streptomyces sp. NPDC047515]|uniref:IS66 family transposase n=1 Tax=Streptomyces sp. NPDC047515 TaxID=3155380 RepID=UPI0033F78D51
MGSGSEVERDDVAVLLAAKDAEIDALTARIAELEGLVAALHVQIGRDSSNSSQPPSSDSPFVKKPTAKRSSRQRSGKKPGKQPGSGGSMLSLVEDPDEVFQVPALQCSCCGAGLAGAPVVGTRRHQVVDVPPEPPRPRVTEYRVQSACCPGCGVVTEAVHREVPAAPVPGAASYGPQVKARAAWLTCAHFLPVRRARRIVNALGGFAVSDGFIAGMRGAAARLVEERFLPHVRALIAAAPVAHADETTARCEGRLRYLHVACTEHLAAMHVGDRSADTIDAGGIWPAFTGVLVRDGYSGYGHLTDIDHAWCGIHLVRDLRAASDADPEGQLWATAMADTLLLANTTAHTARNQGRDALSEKELTVIRNRYAGAIGLGREQNRHGRDPLHDTARTLLRRFERHQDMILRFTVNLQVPFTNNTAELAARSAKVQQRTSGGCWRTLTGLIDFAAVQSYLSTATKWGIDTLDAMTRLFTTGPWLPPAPTPDTAAHPA